MNLTRGATLIIVQYNQFVVVLDTKQKSQKVLLHYILHVHLFMCFNILPHKQRVKNSTEK